MSSSTSPAFANDLRNGLLADVNAIPTRLIKNKTVFGLSGASLALHILKNHDKTCVADNPNLAQYLKHIAPDAIPILPYIKEKSTWMSAEANAWGEYILPRLGDMIMGFVWNGSEPLTFRFLTYHILHKQWVVHVEKTLQPGEHYILPRENWLAYSTYWPPRIHFGATNVTEAKLHFQILYVFLPTALRERMQEHVDALIEQSGVHVSDVNLLAMMESS